MSLLIRKITICRDRRPRRSVTHKFRQRIVFSDDLCYNGANRKPPGGSLWMRATIGVWALPEAFVKQMRNRR